MKNSIIILLVSIFFSCQNERIISKINLSVEKITADSIEIVNNDTVTLKTPLIIPSTEGFIIDILNPGQKVKIKYKVENDIEFNIGGYSKYNSDHFYISQRFSYDQNCECMLVNAFNP